MNGRAEAQRVEIQLSLLSDAERTLTLDGVEAEASEYAASPSVEEIRDALGGHTDYLAMAAEAEEANAIQAERRLRFARWGIIFGGALTSAGLTYATAFPGAGGYCDDESALRRRMGLLGGAVAGVGLVTLVSAIVANARTTRGRRTPRWKLALMALASATMGFSTYVMMGVADADHYLPFECLNS